MYAINKLIRIATNEIGYLEKKDATYLYDKTKNAGKNNYTKYWTEIKNGYQGQPWCAAFVTWCFVQAFGKEKTANLLGHYPFVYCPTLGQIFTNHTKPKVGDIVLFYKNGEFVHTGIVIYATGDVFSTIEGNTSSGNTIIPNGGAVCKKSYCMSDLHGTKFIRPDYSIIESGELNMTQYEELKKMIKELSNPMVYNYIDDNMPDWAKPTIQKLVDKGVLKGDEGGLNLTEDLMRMLVINDRSGLYD